MSKSVRRDLLGHTAKDITDDYTHTTIEMRRKAVALLCADDAADVEVRAGRFQ